ncbi:ATP synthase F1 subunit gamma [Clostridium vincentii]|uniref:ATP synthase gamma chain n=1 Tax=Clostridium vincentii TaxID=52704 RepID=A0A2T0BH45_9CLOT|nr:ATP synthase F1 subunit gamma [Clostridium vincentii]PRR83147.1 ATP synthase gamma chain [Clostridium vincentii]
MGAGGLVDIKRRMKSVKSTRKITSAMALVSTSKLRKCRKELVGNEEYLIVAENTIKSLASAESDSESPYFKKNDSTKKLYIVITSDSGLCAGYNNNVVAYLQQLIGEHKNDASVITVGSKGVSYVRRAGLETVEEYVDISDSPTIKEVKTIIAKALSLYSQKMVSEVHIVYTKFVSPIKQDVKDELLLPIDKLEETVREQIFEPNFETVLANSLEIYLKGKLRSIILSSKCSEQSSRMTAMNGATSNADDIISELSLRYNRIRQASITEEISEIVGGANA